jgi:cell division protein FtsQ
MTRRAARPIRRSRDRDSDGWRGLVTPVRVAGVVLVVAAAGTIGWLVTADAFALGTGGYELNGLRYTDPAAANNAVALPSLNGTNVFRLRTSDIRRRLLELPSVAAADVRVALPDRLIVTITERSPALRVVHNGATYLVDGDGVVLDVSTTETPQVATGQPI